MKNNIKKYNFFKLARRGEDPPQIFQPQTGKDDPYSLVHYSPDKGFKLTTPASEGFMDTGPDSASGWLGNKERGNPAVGSYPTGISYRTQNNDHKMDPRYVLPKDTDPDHPFKNDIPGDNTQYGNGDASSMGSFSFSEDSPLGTSQTAIRNIGYNPDKGNRMSQFADRIRKYRSYK